MLASLPLFGVAAAAGAGEGMKTAPGRKDDKYRVVIQVSDDDPKTWNLALNNARNVQKDLGKENVEIEIVAYGPGLAMLKMESVVGNKVAELRKSGVNMVACQNTMDAQKVTSADLLPDIGFVRAGVVEIMKRQREGWAYIRP
ncbi:DsrE family protein [Pelomicrobium methylotrophicum]|nr:DsrE family protein [Pelomicrobium methylotrophicum]